MVTLPARWLIFSPWGSFFNILATWVKRYKYDK